MEKKSKFKKILKWAAFSLLGIVMVLGLMIWFSPYRKHDGFNYKLIKHSVVINASADSVFHFLGNSANATRWSVFVNHISPLNAQEVSDGKIGSKRRCFCNADEKGQQWDEIITEVIPSKKRQLRTYNYVDFPIYADGLGTEQLYKPLGENKCELSFTVFYLDEPSWTDELKTYFAAYRIKSIFAQNLNNIKRIVETGK